MLERGTPASDTSSQDCNINNMVDQCDSMSESGLVNQKRVGRSLSFGHPSRLGL